MPLKSLPQSKVTAIYQSAARLIGMISFGAAIVWLVNFPPKDTADFYIAFLLFGLLGFLIHLALKSLLWVVIGSPGKPDSREIPSWRKPITLNDLWPKIEDAAAARRHVRRAMVAVVTLAVLATVEVIFEFTRSKIILLLFLHVFDLGVWAIFLWGMSNCFPWGPIGAMTYWALHFFVVASKIPTFPIWMHGFNLAVAALLAHGIRGAIAFQKLSAPDRKPLFKVEFKLLVRRGLKIFKWTAVGFAVFVLIGVLLFLELRLNKTFLGKKGSWWISTPAKGHFLPASKRWTISFDKTRLKWRAFRKSHYKMESDNPDEKLPAGKFVMDDRILLFAWEMPASELGPERKQFSTVKGVEKERKLLNDFFFPNYEILGIIENNTAFGKAMLVVKQRDEDVQRLMGMFREGEDFVFLHFVFLNPIAHDYNLPEWSDCGLIANSFDPSIGEPVRTEEEFRRLLKEHGDKPITLKFGSKRRKL